jgi:chromosome partitioning protein
LEEKMKILALANQKGGVGKTTTAVNLSSCLGAAEIRTLLIDLDPQGNATSGLGFQKHDLTRSIYDVLVDSAPLSSIIQETNLPFLDLAPSNTQLVGAELELVSAFSRESRLLTAIQRLDRPYDFIVIDCPPSLNLLTINALTAASGVLVPVQCEYYAMEGLSELMKTIQLVQNHLNPDLKVEGILLTMFDGRNNLARQVSGEVRGFFGEKVYETKIPRNVKLSESPSHGRSIILYDAHCKGAKSYMDMTRELLGKDESGHFSVHNNFPQTVEAMA